MSHRSIELLIEDLWEAVEKVERYIQGDVVHLIQ